MRALRFSNRREARAVRARRGVRILASALVEDIDEFLELFELSGRTLGTASGTQCST